MSNDPIYTIDAIFLREFKIFPAGLDPSNLLQEQREFLVLIAAMAPSLDGYRRYGAYYHHLKAIKSKNWLAVVREDTDSAVVKIAANARQIDHEAYLELLAKERQKEALESLYAIYPEFKIKDETKDKPDTLGSNIKDSEKQRILERVRQAKAQKALHSNQVEKSKSDG